MTDIQQKVAAKQFIKNWVGHGDEKQETQRFWIDLLQNVFGVDQATGAIEFEVRVKLDHTSFIDGYIKSTHVLIEQKGADIDLTRGYKQSDGSMLTPFQQARRYAGYLPHDMNPRWIVVCNFKEFHIHDMNRPNDTPEIIKLEDLEKEYTRLQFLVDKGNERIQKEMEISLQAGDLVGKLYDALLKQYNSPASEAELKSLNMLCVRLVFCLYAEDAGIFGSHTMFHDYLKGFQAKNIRKALIDLFKVLDTKVADRDPYMDEDLAAFPYVNGGLFADEELIIPRFTEEIIDLLLTRASEDFNWSSISPTIFGAVFESTLNPETRRSGGMHYTSIANIHKVIDPLFYDALAAELDEIAAIPVKKTRDLKLADYQKKLSSLTFLDPACGSGNFLTETYLSLRRLENKAVALRLGDQIVMGDTADFNPIQVSIGQFYGIEINDFAVTVAKTALWIAESQMMKETEEIVRMHLDFLPLTSYANIVEGNALQIDWETVVPKNKLNYIMGNPPFVGFSMMNKSQKDDVDLIFPGTKNVDYVACWYMKAVKYMAGTKIECAFVSTNSICQGEIVPVLWTKLLAENLVINFAHRTFVWSSEAKTKAAVHCIIVGFALFKRSQKIIFNANQKQAVDNINPYLLDGDNVIVFAQRKPFASVPAMVYGNKPADGGNLIIENDEYEDFISKEPSAQKYIRRYVGAVEFLHNQNRYCLWLKGANPKEIKAMPMVMDRVAQCQEMRNNSVAAAIRKFAATPTLFAQITQPDGKPYIIIPAHSSSSRRYIPLGFVGPDVVASNAVFIIPDATLFQFGVLMSNVHNAWMRTTCGRLKSDYRYSKEIVYNCFPWPTPTDEQKARIEQTAQAILDARALYPDCSLADLYDEVLMPPELRKAHQQNDKAVMQAYGFWGKLNTETECVAELMKMYQEITER
ncbi:MAG: class I SAM-dependent DNA methyltransferase [Oscillospiraceae bacterium]|nr:class I SAM-dependent DNA methyltransferase [Oscillospiraceae bacterium]